MASNEHSQNLSEIEKLLQQNVGKEILAKLKNNLTIQGNLKNFDQHMNLTLKKTKVQFKEKNESFEDLLVRGSDILIVSLLENPSTNKE